MSGGFNLDRLTQTQQFMKILIILLGFISTAFTWNDQGTKLALIVPAGKVVQLTLDWTITKNVHVNDVLPCNASEQLVFNKVAVVFKGANAQARVIRVEQVGRKTLIKLRAEYVTNRNGHQIALNGDLKTIEICGCSNSRSESVEILSAITAEDFRID